MDMNIERHSIQYRYKPIQEYSVKIKRFVNINILNRKQ